MTRPFLDLSCMLRFRTRSHMGDGGKMEKTTGKVQLLNAAPLNFLHGVPAPTIPMPICSCDKLPSCYFGKSISSCSSKFVLLQNLSSWGSLSMIDLLKYTVKVDQPLTYNSLTQVLSRYFYSYNVYKSLPLATSQDKLL